jgi:hypothetical protein
MELESTGEKIAFYSYKLLGIISFLYSFAIVLEGSGTTHGEVGFFVILPTTIISIPVLILGPGLSLFIWQNQHLNFIKALSLILVLLLALFQDFTWVTLLLLIAFGVACISIGTERMTRFLNRIGWTHE